MITDVLGWQDLIGVPMTLIVIYTIAFGTKRKYIGSPLKRYFIPALTIKLIGGLMHFAYHYYIYQGGDTFAYYQGINQLIQNLSTYPSEIVQAIFSDTKNYPRIIHEIIHQVHFFTPAESKVIKFGTIFALFNFGSFIGISLCFSFIAFIGLWRTFRLSCEYFPKLHKSFATVILFFPTIVFWASSISKDSLVTGGIGLLLFSIHKVLIKRKNILSNLILIVFSFYMVSSIKGYIIVALIPAIVAWIFFEYKNNIKTRILRRFAAPFFIVMMSISGVLGLNYLSTLVTFQEYLNPEVAQKVVTMYKYLSEQTNPGSAYSLGEMEPTITGIARLIPKAINVTLFRPYLWEANNLVALIAALESCFVFLLSIWVLLVHRLKILRIIFSHPFLIFCITFILILAAAVGLTSGNFGTLVRYKMPLIPFLLVLLIVIFRQGYKKALR